MTSIEIEKKFRELFGSEPLMVRSPGRINLIGEHTDYNDGFVFPAAIDKEVHFAVAANDLGKFRFYANDLEERFEMKVEDLKISDTRWANYLLGVAAQFKRSGYEIKGIDCVFGGDIPLGAGLSSSAAIENGFGFALNEIYGFGESRMDMILKSQKAEHEYAGVMCGIMDQFASMNGKKDHALKLDCRSLDYEYANIDLKDYDIILCDTRVKHELASSEYNTRRKECETGVNILKKYDDKIIALRDVTPGLLSAHRNEFDPVVYKRCNYVVQEDLRVEEAFDALKHNNIKRFGELMYLSHEGLRDEYEVSCKELDLLFDIAKRSDDVLGARMMGGGFGGCTINIVKKEKTETFSKEIEKEYFSKTGTELKIYKVRIVDGTGLI